jgi:hypothetical protein
MNNETNEPRPVPQEGERRWRKKPVVIEAIQFTADNHDECQAWIGDAYDGWQTTCPPHPEMLRIKTLEGVMEASEGDWIIKGVQGEFYPCKPDIFAATYEPTPASPSAVEPRERPTRLNENPTLPDRLRRHQVSMERLHPTTMRLLGEAADALDARPAVPPGDGERRSGAEAVESVHAAALELLRPMSENATTGPWERYVTTHGDPYVAVAGRAMFQAVTNPENDRTDTLAAVSTGPEDYGRANAEFIAAAVNFVRSLLASRAGSGTGGKASDG